MKKKTRFKLKNSFFLPFIIAVSVCLLGAALNSLLFYRSFFRALTKLNEEPIATITFKYKTAQRKFLDRVVWDRLKQNSPVYNGDTIHTSNLSQATIWFSDGNIMDLSENTMAQVFLSEDKSLRADLTGGEAFIDSSEAQGGMTLSANGVQVQLEKGSSVNAKNIPSEQTSQNSQVDAQGEKTAPAAENNVLLQVVKGSASVVSGKKGEEVHSVSQGEALLASNNGTYTEPSLVLSSPVLNERILYHSKDEYSVPFSWKYTLNDDTLKDADTVFEIEVSKNKDFTEIAYKNSFKNQNEITLPLVAGSYWWKVTAKTNESNSVQMGRFQILQSLPPELLVPAQKFEYSYRNRSPAVRLIWTEAEYASSYRLEISDDINFTSNVFDTRLSLASAIVSTLKEGTYFWRVTPYYTINKIGLSSPSETGTFSILKKGELSAPKLLVPAENGILNTEVSEKGLSFSWKMEDEAAKYILKISDTEDFSHTVMTYETLENYFVINQKNKKLKDGKYFWNVCFADSEGNISPLSEGRIFYAMKGSPSQHTIEPVEGYKVASSFVPDTKFTWKKNLPENFTTIFEVATDSDFTNVLYSQETTATSVKGLTLNPGTYYWRIKSFSLENEIKFDSPAKSFSVLEPLPQAVLKGPIERAVARESVPYTFEWEEVPEADFYKFTLYKNNSDTPLYEDNVYDTKVLVDMFNPKEFVDKSYYRYTVQAQANAIPGFSSRRTGKLAEQSFFLIKLRPVEVSIRGYTGKNIKIKGEDAILNPVSATWSSVDKVKQAQFVLTKTDVNPEQIIIKTPSDEESANGTLAAKSILLDTKDGLRAGEYEIIVYAKTLDGIDISNTDAKNRFKFTILPVSPLEKAKNLISSPQVFNREYLLVKENPKNITLKWQRVPKATDYFVSIKNNRGRTVLEQNIKDATQYTIDFTKLSEKEKSVFSKGKFTWSVVGVRRIDTNKDGILDKIFQESPEASSVFETDIPSPKKTKTKGAANPYGK